MQFFLSSLFGLLDLTAPFRPPPPGDYLEDALCVQGQLPCVYFYNGFKENTQF